MKFGSKEVPGIIGEAGGLRKAVNPRSFVVVNFKHSVQLANLQQIVHPLGKVQQLELPALFGDPGEASH